MNLDYSDEQRALSEALRRLLTNECPPKVVRQMESDALGYPRALWSQLTEMGLAGLTVPEEFGGLAQGALDTALVYEEFGRALCPSPHFISSIVAASIVNGGGTLSQKREWLPAIADGSKLLTLALLEPGNDYNPVGIQLRATRDAKEYRVTGTKYCVPFATAADGILTVVRVGPAEQDIDILFVDPRAPGLSIVSTPTLGSDAQHQLRFEDVVVPESARIGAHAAGWSHWTSALTDGMIAAAAWAVGCADRAHEMATHYAKERVQFGRPIGSFQGISHPLATVAMEIAGARPLVHQAAWARAQGQPAIVLAAMAKLHADFVNRHATAVGHQTLGGIGFTLDIDMQLYFRRAKQAQLSWGDPRYLENLIATSVLEGNDDGL